MVEPETEDRDAPPEGWTVSGLASVAVLATGLALAGAGATIEALVEGGDDTPYSLLAFLPGAFFMAWGTFEGQRSSCALGAVTLGVGVLVSTRHLGGLWAILAVALLVTAVVAMVTAADLSFSTRRAMQVDSATTQGVLRSVGAATALGVGASGTIVAVVAAGDWPAWMLAAAVGGLAVAALGLWVFSARSRRRWSARDSAGEDAAASSPAEPSPA